MRKLDTSAGFPGHAAPACDVPDNGPNSALMHGPSAGRRGWSFQEFNFIGIVDMLDDLPEIPHVEPTVVRFAPRQTERPPEGGLSIGKRAGYILSWVFIFSDLVIFFLLTLSFDISPLDMLSLWAAGPVVGGLVVSVD